jgi:uncharacterized membrane protein YhiD involved in acid resistance
LNYFGATDVIINLTLAFILGLMVALTYRITNRHRATQASYLITLVILSLIVALVMMVIGNSIARAFGLVGTLSIIRFRTAIKDNRDLVFVFFALAAGMTAGIGNYQLALYGVGLIILYILIMDFGQFGASRKRNYLLRFQIDVPNSEKKQYFEVFKRALLSFTQLSIKSVRMGDYLEQSYLVRLRKNFSEQSFIAELSALDGMEGIVLIAEDNGEEI